MKVVILAGGFGTRLSEYTEHLPKPMVEIGGKPILFHIMELYVRYGFYDFVIALGYKGGLIKRHFLELAGQSGDISLDLNTGKVKKLKDATDLFLNCNVELIETGPDSLTGTRLKKLAPYLNDDCFMLTYGDGVSDVNLRALLRFHKSKGKLATMTAVHPAARFGELSVSEAGLVTEFEEKPQLQQGWINGGFFVFQRQFLDLIPDIDCMLERAPLAAAIARNEMAAYKHNGYWQCMDNKRDWELLDQLANTPAPPWFQGRK